MTLRVLWVIDSLGPGGAESLMPSLLEHLSTRDVQSRVCVLQSRLGNPVAGELKKRGIAVEMVQVDNLHALKQIMRLFRYIRQYKPDIIHTQLETSDILANVASIILGIPSVSTLHTLGLPSKKRTSHLRNFIRRFCLNYFCDMIIAVSDVTRLHYIKLGVNSNKLITLYNGIDLNRFNLTKIIFKDYENKNMMDNDIILMTVAVLREAKGIQYMIRALPFVLERFPNVRYVIVGDGDYRSSLEELSKSIGVSDRVVFAGYKDNIPEILAESDLFVFPTLNDALPTVLLEGMAVGVPIIASEVGGVPEILVHNQNGLMVPQADSIRLADACIRLLSDRVLMTSLKMAGRETIVKKFDINQQVNNLIGLYHQLVYKSHEG